MHLDVAASRPLAALPPPQTESQSKIGYLASGAALAAYCFHSPTRRLVNGLLTNMAAAVGSAALQFHSPMLMVSACAGAGSDRLKRLELRG